MSTPNRARKHAKRETVSPYEGFAEHVERLITRIETSAPINVPSARSRYQPTGDYPTWNKGGAGRKPQPLYEDLAVGLWAVRCVGKNGISYGQLDRCFTDCVGVGCHNNKAAAIFAALQRWGLIIKIGNYSAGSKGNQYAVAPEMVEFMGSG